MANIKLNIDNYYNEIDSGYLKETGWIYSVRSGGPFTKNGEPIPWTTYSFLDFIDKRLDKKMSIFEFGCGNSTLYFAKRVGNVCAVDHDIKWHNKLIKDASSNLRLLHRPLDEGEYFDILDDSDEQFDIIFIDGRERFRCIISSLKNLKPNGVFILDDSERANYKKIFQFMKDSGFKELTFSGLAPLQSDIKSTTIFYREKNVLNI